ncbi:MAG: hypothetical protein ACRECH_13750 [Nitrososphaerales archaeon]
MKEKTRKSESSDAEQQEADAKFRKMSREFIMEHRKELEEIGRL